MIPTIQDIERFVIESGSDSIPTFGGSFEGGIHCQQVPDEIAPCIHAILKSGLPVKRFLEIGVAAGGTTYLMNHFFQPETIVLIDDGKHHKAGLRPSVLAGIKYHELVGRSDDESVIVSAAEYAPYDLILVDGDHLYPGVKLDCVTYAPMLAIGGFLALHDSAMQEWGVCRMVRELMKDENWAFLNEYRSEKHTRLGLALFMRIK